MSVVFVSVAWLVGIWFASVSSFTGWLWLCLGLVGLFYKQDKRVQITAVCLFALGLGGWRYGTAVPDLTAPAHIASYNGSRSVQLIGLVSDEPDVRDRSVNLRLQAEQLITPDGETIPIEGDILIRTFRFPVVQYGTRVRVEGRLDEPPRYDTFDYQAYLARQGIYSYMSLPSLVVLEENAGQPIYQALFAFKNRASTTIAQILPHPQSDLLTGILLGDDNGLPPELAEQFRITGMTHIIAISGFNIALIIAIFLSVGDFFLSKRGAGMTAIVGIVVYTLLVGADASVVRAAVMGVIFVLTRRGLGRPTFAYSSLFVAGALMTLWNPLTLWDVGFQLSFAATLSLMLYADPISRVVRRWLLKRFHRHAVKTIMNLISEPILITISAQILTLPLMMGYFGQLSLISFVANALILPAQTGVMLWGGLATLLGLVWLALGQVLGWIAFLFLWYTTSMVRLLATVPLATVPIDLSAGGVVLIYGVIGAISYYALHPERETIRQAVSQNFSQRVALTGSVLIALVTGGWANTQPDGRLHIHFLDVGQGDATLIVTPTGRQILIDGGYYPTVLNDHLGTHIPFWDTSLDMVIATHADADHVSGLVEVFERYEVSTLMTDGTILGASNVYDEMLNAAMAQDVPVHVAQAGETIIIEDGVRLEIVHPAVDFVTESRNDNSVSVRVVYGDFSVLLTGDAEIEGEQAMLTNGSDLSALVMKAGHHGANNATSPALLWAVQPQIVVVSSGEGNNFGHPHPDVLARVWQRGTAVLRTDQLGTISVATDGQAMWWTASR